MNKKKLLDKHIEEYKKGILLIVGQDIIRTACNAKASKESCFHTKYWQGFRDLVAIALKTPRIDTHVIIQINARQST